MNSVLDSSFLKYLFIYLEFLFLLFKMRGKKFLIVVYENYIGIEFIK